MKTSKKIITSFLILSMAFIFSSCINPTGNENLVETLDPIEEVVPIIGAENSTLNVNRGTDSYFRLGFNDLQSNNIIVSGAVGDGWCIDWQKPIDSNNGTYSNIPLYSTFNVKAWNPLNYLLNIKEELMQNDSELTYREIQVAIWSLRGFPEFNLESIAVDDLPSRMRTNGEANFSYDKVNTILNIVESEYEDFDFVEGTKFAVIAETPTDVQTVITVVN